MNIPVLLDESRIGKIESVEPLEGGSVNETYKLYTANGNFVLKLNGLDELAVFQKERYCHELASQVGVLSSKVINVGTFENKSFILLEFIEGLTGKNIDKSARERVWKKLGQYALKLSKIKDFPVDKKIPTIEAAKSHFERDYLQYEINQLDKHDFFLKENLITVVQQKKILERFLDLKSREFDFGLVHGDLSLENAVYSQGGGIHLIDWGSAGLDRVPHFEITLAYENLLLKESFKSQYFEAFLEGMELGVDFVQNNIDLFDSLLILYLMDKIRWARERDKKESLAKYSEKFKRAIEQLSI